MIMVSQPRGCHRRDPDRGRSSPSRHSPNCVVGKRSRQLVLCPINAQIAHPRARVLVVPQVLHFLFAITLVAYPRREKSTVSPRAARSLHLCPSFTSWMMRNWRSLAAIGLLSRVMCSLATFTLPILRRVRNVPAGRRPYLLVGPGPASLGAGLRAVEVQVEDYAGPRCVSERETTGMKSSGPERKA